MSEEERSAIVALVAGDPEHGVRPAGWGGGRKVRFGRTGGGKSGGYRIVSVYCGPETPVFLVTMFAKGEKDNLSRSEAQQLGALVKRLCATYGAKEDV